MKLSETKIAAIIPARMASTRLPGKPLLKIEGLPLLEHVRRRTLLCRGFSEVVVATCDSEIADMVESYGGKVIFTSSKHRVATERIIEAMRQLDCTHVLNVQGDEILVLPSDLEKMVNAMKRNPEVPVWNAVANIESKEILSDAAVVKCVLSKTGKILFCSRHFLHLGPVHWVIGILGYSRPFLERFQTLAPSPLEEKESIEQLRILENDYPITAVPFEKAYPGINEPREVQEVEKYLKEDPLQRAMLNKILERSL